MGDCGVWMGVATGDGGVPTGLLGAGAEAAGVMVGVGGGVLVGAGGGWTGDGGVDTRGVAPGVLVGRLGGGEDTATVGEGDVDVVGEGVGGRAVFVGGGGKGGMLTGAGGGCGTTGGGAAWV